MARITAPQNFATIRSIVGYSGPPDDMDGMFDLVPGLSGDPDSLNAINGFSSDWWSWFSVDDAFYTYQGGSDWTVDLYVYNYSVDSRSGTLYYAFKDQYNNSMGSGSIAINQASLSGSWQTNITATGGNPPASAECYFVAGHTVSVGITALY